jgi:hypothetical protein
MTEASADLPPYEPQRILSAPFPEKVRLVCRTWAAGEAATPLVFIALYWVKYLLLYVGGWAFFVSFSADYAGLGQAGVWAFTLVAFQKAIVWSIVYELLGFGCSMGPMNARYWPPVGGFLYFLRPGSTKLTTLPGAPIIGGITRTWLDVGLFAAIMLLSVRALVAPEITSALLWPIVVLIPLLGLSDRTIFLAARSEHYWVALVCLAAASEGDLWISACKIIWCMIWFWAATSKVNSHFPSVIMVMMNNGPFFPKWLKKRLFVSYPDDLRPSRIATLMAHGGTATEYMIPVLLLLTAGNPIATGLVLFLMFGFHGFIAANNPSGMPIDWNILMIYGGIFLFGFHPEASVLAVGSMPLLCVFLALFLFAIPLFGNLFPSKVSFLLSMRYYAGNWAYNIWLFRGESEEKLGKLTKAAGSFREQLGRLVPDEETLDVAVALSLSHRFMHLEGRPLLEALPRAVDDIEEYDWVEGEILAGAVIGWNFGDGHLNNTQLLEAIQAQCGFEEGELRVVMVESQPLFGRTMHWQVVDAATGLVDEGETEIASMRELQPWPTGEYADALMRGRPTGLA